MKFTAPTVRLLVKDFPTSFDFYTQTLGLSVLWGDRNGPFASFCAPGGDKPLLSAFAAALQGMFPGYTPPSGTGVIDQTVIIWPTADIDADYETLKARGVVFLGPPTTIPEWMMRCTYFRDPEGNLFELSNDGVAE